jgi:hypothetical protein
MKSISKSSLLALALFAAAGANAQTQGKTSQFYGEAAVAPIRYEEAGYSFTPTAIRGILGYEAHPNFAFEGMFGFGVSEGSTQIRGANVTFSVDNTFGIYVRPKVALTPEFELFGRLGFARSGATLSVQGGSISSSESDMSYGFGAALKLSPALALVGDYMSYYNKNGVNAKGVGIGLRFSF